MSDVVLSALIATLGGVITAAITALVPLLIEIRKQEFEIKKRELDRKTGQKRTGSKSEKNKKSTKVEQRNGESSTSTGVSRKKPRIDWRRTGLLAIVVAGILFSGRMIYILASGPQPPSTASLSAAIVEFRITANGSKIIIPAGGILDNLHPGDQVNVETQVKDTKGIPYPNPLTITYYFGSGTTLRADIAPYLVKPNDTINVKIEDQVTGEVITRILRVSAN